MSAEELTPGMKYHACRRGQRVDIKTRKEKGNEEGQKQSSRELRRRKEKEGGRREKKRGKTLKTEKCGNVKRWTFAPSSYEVDR